MSRKRKKNKQRVQASNDFNFNKNASILNLIEMNKQEYKKSNKKIKVLMFIIIIEIIIILCLSVLLINEKNNGKIAEPTIKEEEKEQSIYLFLGDSITNQYDLEKYYPSLETINSGINGNRTEDILEDMKNRVFQHQPTDVIILIGINQIERDSVDKIVDDIKKIVDDIKTQNNKTNIYIQSVYPVNAEVENTASLYKDNNKIIEVNKKLKEYTEESDVKYVDIYDKLLSEDGKLDEIYTQDGLHLNDKAYEIITNEIIKMINIGGKYD